jgi:MFS family permease
MAKSESGALTEWRKNWKVVLSAGCGMSLVTMPTFGLGTFLAPLEAEFGWSRAQITSVLVIIAAFALCMGPVAGAAVDRFGPRRIGIAGVFLVCASVAMLSLTGSSIVSWWALWTIVALVAPFAGPSVWFSGVTSFFSAGRGLALGVTLCGSSIGTSLVPVLGHHLIENHGWRVAYLGIGAAFLFIVALPVLLFFTSAQDKVRTSLTTGAKSEAAVLTGPTAGQVFRSLKFARMALAAFGMTLCASSLIINLVPILVANGHAAASAASMAGVLGLAAIAGRLLMGALLDRFNANVITASVITMASVSACCSWPRPGYRGSPCWRLWRLASRWGRRSMRSPIWSHAISVCAVSARCSGCWADAWPWPTPWGRSARAICTTFRDHTATRWWQRSRSAW